MAYVSRDRAEEEPIRDGSDVEAACASYRRGRTGAAATMGFPFARLRNPTRLRNDVWCPRHS